MTDTQMLDLFDRIESLAQNVEVEFLAQVNGHSYNPRQTAALKSVVRALDA